jgi:hypothetical protein
VKFSFIFGRRAEIQQEAKLDIRGAQIVDQPGLVRRYDPVGRFQLDNYQLVHQQVCKIFAGADAVVEYGDRFC